MTDSSNNSEEESEDRCCYICWDDNETEENPIRRDCQCKGSSGWVHVQCLVSLANRKVIDGPLTAILRPWMKCAQCQEPYRDPTKEALRSVVVLDPDRSRRRKRIIHLFRVGLVNILIYCAFFVFSASFNCLLDFTIRVTEIKVVPQVEILWAESSRGMQDACLVVCGLALSWVIYKFWVPLIRGLQRVAFVVSTIFVMTCVLTESPRTGAVALAFWLPLAAYVGYRARHQIRNELVQIRRRGLLSALSSLICTACILYVEFNTNNFVRRQYFRSLHRLNFLFVQKEDPDDLRVLFQNLLEELRRESWKEEMRRMELHREFMADLHLDDRQQFFACCM